DWESATLSKRSLEDEVLALRQQPGNDIYIGSRSLIIQLLNLHLVDEFQLCVYPVIAGSGLQLFENINGRSMLKLMETKIFESGAVLLHYQPEKKCEE